MLSQYAAGKSNTQTGWHLAEIHEGSKHERGFRRTTAPLSLRVRRLPPQKEEGGGRAEKKLVKIHKSFTDYERVASAWKRSAEKGGGHTTAPLWPRTVKRKFVESPIVSR